MIRAMILYFGSLTVSLLLLYGLALALDAFVK